VVPGGVHQQQAIAQLEQKHQSQLAALFQQLADAEERAQSQKEMMKAAENHTESSNAVHT